MKKFFKLGCLGFIGLIALIIIIALVSSGNDDPSNSSEGSTSKSDSKKEEQLPIIGESLQVGDVEFLVTDKSTSKNVGGEYGQNAQATYLILDVTVTNIGNEAITVDNTFFKLKSGEKTYESDGSAGIYANEQTDFFLTKVNPDLSLSGKVIFDVSDEVINASELILNVQTGLFGTEEGQIDITDK